MNISINKISDWDEVYDSALFTQKKSPEKQFPSSKWKIKTCYANHSILRDLIFSIKIEDVDSEVIAHLIRHKKNYSQPYVQTLREDLTGIPRESITRLTKNGVKFIMNASCIIDVSRARKCFKSLSKTTDVWNKVLDVLKDMEPELFNVCVSQCVANGFCTEYKTCGFDETKIFGKERAEYKSNCIKNNRK